jgi:hypothetical protein
MSAKRALCLLGDQPGSQQLLREALETYGRPEMARDFCGSGNRALKLAAKNWAEEKNYFQVIPECEDKRPQHP